MKLQTVYSRKENVKLKKIKKEYYFLRDCTSMYDKIIFVYNIVSQFYKRVKEMTLYLTVQDTRDKITGTLPTHVLTNQ